MRERRALMMAAWRELWPVAALAMGVALASVPSNFGERPDQSSLILLFIPVALYAGVASGRATGRTLAFLLARPSRREHILASRAGIALGSLLLGWTVAALPSVLREPQLLVVLDLLMLLALVLVAFVSAMIGAIATEQEPLALGIGALLCCALLLGLLMPVDALGITTMRVLRAHPLGVLALTFAVLAAFYLITRNAWRWRLPVRDRGSMKQLVVSCAASWAASQLLCLALVWSSASASNAQPIVLLGVEERGPIIAAGSPGKVGGEREPRLDAIRAGQTILFDVTGQLALLEGCRSGTVTRAARAAGRIAMTVVSDPGAADEICRLVLLLPDGASRDLGKRCGPLWLSPTGASLAVQQPARTELIDTESGTIRDGISLAGRRIVGWSGEEPVTYGLHGALEIRVGATTVGHSEVMQARLSTDGGTLAVVVTGGVSLLPADDTVIGALTLSSGEWVRYRVSLSHTQIVGWLDPAHIAVVGRSGVDRRLVVLAVATGEVTASMPFDYGLPVEHIDGPLQGPWLLTRSGTLLEAWAPGVGMLWREQVAILPRDAHDVRRWAVDGGQIMAIDHDGRLWQRPVPWKVQ